MLRLVTAYVGRIFRSLRSHKMDERFDAIYYIRRYSDLGHFRYSVEAERHYNQHGKGEGRFPNELAEQKNAHAKYQIESDDFDLYAYRTLNPDLSFYLSKDKDFILHYIRHGRMEGRPSSFSDSGQDNIAPWERKFSVSQFSAWISGRLPAPINIEDAKDKFKRHGVNLLAPIGFEYLFDPHFYRMHYRVQSHVDDVRLYEMWLNEGLLKGHHPNEQQFLRPYIGENDFPDSFDWASYGRSRLIDPISSRSLVLIHLFEKESKWEDALSYFRYLDAGIVAAVTAFRLREGRAKDAEYLLRIYGEQGGDWPAHLWALLGDVQAELGRCAASREAYERALATEGASLRAVVGAVRANIAVRDFERACGILKNQRGRWGHETKFEQLVAQTIDEIFEHASARAHATLAAASDGGSGQDPLSEMGGEMSKSLRLIERAIEDLETAPARLGPLHNGHIALLGNEGLPQCRHYRVEQKEQQLAAAGFEVRRYPMDDVEAFIRSLIGARIAIFYRVQATPAIIRAILTARQMGIPTYYEIDDLIFSQDDYPASYANYQSEISLDDYRGLQFSVPLFRFAMSLCDRAIASTPALLEQMKPIVRGHDGILLRNGLDSRNSTMIALGCRSERPVGSRVRIFYGSGTLAHGADFSDIAVPALERLMNNCLNVDLVLVGHVPHDPRLEIYRDRILRYPMMSDIEEYWSVLSGCDINIAVLFLDNVAHCKSEIKWIEAAVLSIPTVASATTTYREVIDSGVDGVIAETAEQWEASLTQLCTDADLRHRMGAAARGKALERYSLSEAAKILLREFASPPIAHSEGGLRVLVCNVFFAPHSIGGATRVVENNVAAICKDAPDIEIAVFCTDLTAGSPGNLRTSEYCGIPVFRLALADYPGCDLAPFAPENAAAFREVVKRFQPDLVHFHCVQRLTATVVRECLEMNIPYVVTVHDAWWISQYQFLVDEEGILRLPQPDLFASFTPDARQTDTALRRRRLEALLAGAERIIAVSESFAKVYRDAGVTSVIAIPNGVPDLPAPREPDRHNGPLRLALVGGRSSHKGADLVEAALRLGDYANLHLLMIDGRLAPGEKHETRWGSTAVTISAPFAQNDVSSLYGGMDVLLAPSTWPESFGLVAREAAHFGLWVVASALGAMGDDIIEGENGFRVDTSDRRGINRVLRLLNDAPDNYRQGTARPAGKQRHAREQAKDLVKLYRELVVRPSNAERTPSS